MRKIGITLVVIIVLLVIAVALLPFLVDVNRYRGKVQAELQQRTGRPVSLGNMDLKIFPLAFRIENAVIGEDPAIRSSQPFVQVKELLVSAEIMPLLRGDVKVGSLELHQPKIELIRTQNGAWNFSTLGETAQGTQPAPTGAQKSQAPEPSAPAQRQFTLDRLRVLDGQVAVTDLQKKQPRSVYDHIDLEVRDYAPNKAVGLELAAHLPGAGKQTIQLKGKGGPFRQGDPAGTDFNGELELQEVSLSGLQKFLNSSALQGMEFTATGTAQISNKSGVATSKGKLDLKNGRVRGVDIGYPISADYAVRADTNTKSITIDKGDLRLGSTPLSIMGLVNAGPTPTELDIKIKTSGASISDAARLASAFGVAFNPGTQVKGQLDADIVARGSTATPILNGTLAARELVITGKNLPQAVQVTAVNLALTPEAVRSNEFVATTGGTAVKVNFNLINYGKSDAAVDATVRAPSAQLGELINIAQAYGVSAVDNVAGSGAVSLDVRAQGQLKQPAAMVYSGSGRLQNGTLKLPSLTKPINIKNADLRFTQDSAVLENAAFSLGSTNATGQLTLRGLAPGAAPVAQFNLAADKWVVNEWKQMMVNPPVAAPARTENFDLVPRAHAQSKTEPPLITRLTGTGDVQIANVFYDELQLVNVRSGVTIDRGVFRLSPFTAQVYGGTQTGTVVVDVRPNPSTYTVKSKLLGVDANQLLSSLSNTKKILYGVMSANADTRFSGASSTEAAKTLDGTVNLDLQKGKLVGIDLLNQLARIGQFVQGQKASEPFTNIAKLNGDFKLDHGVAETNNLKAVIDAGTVAANGRIDLASQTVNMQAAVVLSKAYAQTVGGTGIGGFLVTALANKQGELVMPVLITGNLNSPTIAPDYKTIAQMKLENVLPSTGAPGGIGGLVQGILGGKQPANAQPTPQEPGPKGQEQPAKPASPFQGILDALGAKQQKKQQPPPQPPKQGSEEKVPDPKNPK